MRLKTLSSVDPFSEDFLLRINDIQDGVSVHLLTSCEDVDLKIRTDPR